MMKMRYPLLAVLALPLFACSSAGDPAPDTDLDDQAISDGADGAQSDAAVEGEMEIPVYQLAIEEGHIVNWYEQAPGQVAVLESGVNDQQPRVDTSLSVVQQFQSLRPGVEVPKELTELAERVEMFRGWSPEEIVAVADQYGFEGLTLEHTPREPETLVEGKPDIFVSDTDLRAPGLTPLGSVGAPDSGDDSAYTKAKFIDNSSCDNPQSGSEIRRTRRTGSDDMNLYDLHAGYATAASYRNTVRFIVKRDKHWDGLGWKTLLDTNISEGTRTWYVYDGSGDTFESDLKSHIREASGDGWHHCLKKVF